MKITIEKVRRLVLLAPLRLKKRISSPFLKKCRKITPIFLFGSHRSGTNMLLDVLEHSPGSLIFNENDRRAFKKYRIKDQACRLYLLRNSRCPVVLFKPLNDVSHALQLMEEHPDCKIVWIYRQYQDVVNSSCCKWKDEIIDERHIFADVLNNCGQSAYTLMSEKNKQAVRNYIEEGLDSLSAWALHWYLLNNLFFQYGLNSQSERVLLVKYEALVKNPSVQFKRLFEFLELDFCPTYTSSVFRTSVDKYPYPHINSEIQILCEEVSRKLDNVWWDQQQVNEGIWKKPV